MQILRDHSTPITAIAFSPDGRQFASADTSERVHLRDLSDPERLTQALLSDPMFDRFVTGLAFTPDGTQLIACRHDSHASEVGARLGFWTLPSLDRFTQLRTSVTWNTALALEPSGESMLVFGACRSDTCVMERWRLDEGRPMRMYAGMPHETLPAWAWWFPWRTTPARLAVGRRWVAVGYSEGPQVGYQNRHQPGRIRTFKPHPTSIRALAMHPTENVLVSAGPKEARIWALPKRTQIAELPRSGTELFNALAFSPDGGMLAVGRNRGLVTWWDTSTWTETGTFRWPIGNVQLLAFAPDGLRIAAAGDNGAIVIWDVE